jgi:hypothetical protein
MFSFLSSLVPVNLQELMRMGTSTLDHENRSIKKNDANQRKIMRMRNEKKYCLSRKVNEIGGNATRMRKHVFDERKLTIAFTGMFQILRDDGGEVCTVCISAQCVLSGRLLKLITEVTDSIYPWRKKIK